VEARLMTVQTMQKAAAGVEDTVDIHTQQATTQCRHSLHSRAQWAGINQDISITTTNARGPISKMRMEMTTTTMMMMETMMMGMMAQVQERLQLKAKGEGRMASQRLS
jgi:hypothetical protein